MGAVGREHWECDYDGKEQYHENNVVESESNDPSVGVVFLETFKWGGVFESEETSPERLLDIMEFEVHEEQLVIAHFNFLPSQFLIAHLSSNIPIYIIIIFGHDFMLLDQFADLLWAQSAPEIHQRVHHRVASNDWPRVQDRIASYLHFLPNQGSQLRQSSSSTIHLYLRTV